MSKAQFLLFLDPITETFYSYCEELGIIVKQNPPKSFQKQAASDLNTFQILRGKRFLDKISSFQNRPIPISFLATRRYRFPIYSTTDPLHEAMVQQFKFKQQGNLVKNNHKQYLSVRVYFGSIQQQLKQSKTRTMHDQYIDCLDIKYIASVNQIIRTVCRLILQQQKIVITMKQETSRLILKVKNRQEYMYGNEPISSYYCVLECIRQDKILQVQIIEANVHKQRSQFNKFIFQRSLKDIYNNVFQSFPWQDLNDQQCGFLMWHVPDNFYLDSQYIQSLDLDRQSQLKINKSKIRIAIADKEKLIRSRIPRFLLKQSTRAFIEKRRQEMENKLITIEGAPIYTGECLFSYSFQIIGIKNLFALLHLLNPTKKKTKRPILKLTTSSKQQKQQHLTNLETPAKRYQKLSQIKRQGKFPIVPFQFNIVVNFFYGSQKVLKKKSPMALVSNIVETDFTIQWGSLSNLMLQTSIVFKVKFYSKQGEKVSCGIGVIKAFDEYGYLRQGKYRIQMQAHQNVNKIKLGCYEHQFQTESRLAEIYVNFPKFRQPVKWSLYDMKCATLLGYVESKSNEMQPNIEDKMSDLIKLLSYDPLKMMNYDEHEKKLLRSGKKYYKHQPSKLINYLYAVNWTNPFEIAEAYLALKNWATLSPLQALFLLNPRISDQKIRYYAVKLIDQMKNHQFCLYSNQITQALVSFQTHENPLIDLIIERCCQDPYVVAQQYFWQFWNRLDEKITTYRFNIYLQTLILTCPIRKQFLQQVKTNQKLIQFNQTLVKKTQNWEYYKKNEAFKKMVTLIENQLINIDNQKSGFRFPLRPERYFQRLIPESSKMFDSKKLPFALACTNATENAEKQSKKQKQKPEYMVMFKYGDDIKQDHLVLQIFTIFNKLWIQEGLDLKMNIYKVLATGDGIGFIQIVQNAENSSYIHKQYSNNLLQALDQQTTYKYLKTMNPDEEKFRVAKQNFIRSSAAYLVATYVMGIGDRHSGNYMIQGNGKFFHIDFGHILGNFKTKYNIKRQRTPFVFTSEFSYVMGGQKSNAFARFEVLCANAYNILRKNGSLIINLMMMIVGSEIPQIQSYEHIQYAVDKLNLEMSDLQASQHITKQIKKTLESNSRKYDNLIHEKKRVG